MYLEIYLEAYTWNLSNSNITSDYVFTAIAMFFIPVLLWHMLPV